MPTLLQFASLFNIFGCALVLALSALTLRLRPEPFFRYWVYAYSWAVIVTIGITVEATFGRSTAYLAANLLLVTPSLWFHFRMGFELLGRPFPAARAGAALVGLVAVGAGMYLVGPGYDAAMATGAIAIMVTYIWLGSVMLRVGRTASYRGMGWIGAPVLIQGAWLATYPLLIGTPIFWVGFAVAAMLAIGTGVGMAMYVLFRTTRQLAEQNDSLAAAERSLRETDRLQREFLNAASHELRTPLTSIVGYAEFLADGVSGDLNPRQAEYVGQIQRGAVRLTRLVDDMLDFAVLEAGQFALQPQAVDVAAVVRHEASSLLPLAREKQVRLDVAVPDQPLPLRADPLRIGQVVTNLVGNALKFTRPGGTVQVEARATARAVRVEVRDDGIGIAPEHVAKLFTKFYRVDPTSTRDAGGAGLGLAISRALVEAHGGRIGVESVPGRGSTFWFEIPAVGAPEAAAVELRR